MKKWLTLLLFAGIILQANSNPGILRAYLSYSAFYSPEHGPYLETYLAVLGKSIIYIKKDNGKYQGTVLVTMLFKQQDSIREFRKYELSSPEVEDTTAVDFSFLDQQRIPLPDGSYEFELSIADKNRKAAPFNVSDNLVISFPKDKLSVSGIELVESFQKATETSQLTKSGYDFIPYLDNFFPSAVNKITYYAEVYHASSAMLPEEKFAIITSIQSFETGTVVSDYQRLKRESAKTVNVVFGEFDIKDLPSGNYNLVISVRDKENKELASNLLFFQRSNPNARYDLTGLASVDLSQSFSSQFLALDTLREYIRCLYPISSAPEKLFIRSQLKVADLNVLQQFFHAFWTSRYPLEPEKAWRNYYYQVLSVNKDFGTSTRKGYETDRGRVYLQYGPPNTRVEDQKDPRMYPYEIWQYYKAGNQSNRRFVFYSNDIALNDYQMVHSDVTGEVYNPWWQQMVKRFGPSGRDPDNDYLRRPSESEDEYWGGHSSDYYILPR
jgi:GWxTD domain-containing protein